MIKAAGEPRAAAQASKDGSGGNLEERWRSWCTNWFLPPHCSDNKALRYETLQPQAFHSFLINSVNPAHSSISLPDPFFPFLLRPKKHSLGKEAHQCRSC